MLAETDDTSYEDELRHLICTISSKDLAEAKMILRDFQVGDAYRNLHSRPFDELSDIEALCFALTRKAEDTKKFNSTQLNQVLNRQTYGSKNGSYKTDKRSMPMEHYPDEDAITVYKLHQKKKQAE